MAISFKQNYPTGIIFDNGEDEIKDFIFDLYVYNPASTPSKSPEYIHPELSSLIESVRDYFLKIPDNVNYVTFDDGSKQRKFNNKNGTTDHLVATLKIKNPKVLGFNSPFNLDMRIEPTGSDKIFYQKSFPISRITQYTSLDSFNPSLQLSNSTIDFTQVSETVRIYNLNIVSSDVSSLISSGSTTVSLEIINDENNLVFFDNGTKKKTINVSKSNIGVVNEKLTIKNPGTFDYNKIIDIKYSLNYSLTASLATGITTVLKSGLLFEKELPLTIKTTFEKPEVVNTNLDIIFDNLSNVNFLSISEPNKNYQFKCNIQNVNSLTENHVFQIKIENDIDQLLTFVDNNSRILEITDLQDIVTNVAIKNPGKFDYNQNVNFVCTIQKVEANGLRTNIFDKTFSLNLTVKNANLNNEINIYLNSFSKVIFDSVHEFRRNVNFNFLNQNIEKLDPTGEYLFQLQILDDVDDLIGVFNDDTKLIEFDLSGSLNIPINITNPTSLNYNKTLNLKTTIFQINPNDQQKIVVFSKLIPINIVTTYSTVKRAIFKGEREINISNINLIPKPIQEEIENKIFLNETAFQPLIELSDDNEIIFDNFDTIDKTVSFNLSITGLDIGEMTLKLQQSNPFVLFENGLKEIVYDINTDNVFEISIPILVQNPYRINYQKEFEMMVVISDLIDEYAKKFKFKITTSYNIENLQDLIISSIKNIEKKLLQSITSIDENINPSLTTLQLLDNTNFQTLNTTIENIDVTQITNNLNLPILFDTLKNALLSENLHLESDFKYIDNSYLTKNDLEIFLTDSNNNTLKVNENLIQVDSKSLHINKPDIQKGRYIIQIKQKKTPIKILNVKSSTAFENYTIIQITDKLDTNYGENFKINFNGIDYLIISNTSNQILVFGNLDLIENDKINLINNIFEDQIYMLEINNYDIDDIGMIFLNKKITNLDTKNEKFYDENENVIFELNYLINGNLETRTKN